MCQAILSRYSKTGTIRVPIPPYRGFHVRPATLVAKIARHYGGQLRVRVLGKEYDAAVPLELFRANEEVNAEKRRRLSEKLLSMDLLADSKDPEALAEVVRGTVLRLAEQREVVIYEQPLPIGPQPRGPEESVLEYCAGRIKKLLALGKIDLDLPIEAEFSGDLRILEDVRALAESGYGEDRQGHNVNLAPQLAYLRRTPGMEP